MLRGMCSCWLPVASLLLCAAASATTPEFVATYVLPTDGNVIPLSTGGQITFPAISIQATITATIVVANRGTGPGLLNAIAVSGGSFQLVSTPLLPAPIDAGKELRFGVAFSPAKAGSFSGTLSLTFPDRRPITVSVVGTTAAPEFRPSYYIQADGNAVFVDAGGKIVFPATKINASAAAVVTLSNYGTGAGYINSITLTGQAFQLNGVVALPILIAPGRELRFGVVYNPTRLEASTGSLKVAFDDRTITLDVTGTATGSSFTYSVLRDGVETPYSTKDTISLPDTALRETTRVTMQVKNSGTADGAIAGALVSGQGFQLSNLPIFPVVVAPGAAVQFTMSFTPVQPGESNGRLQIGADAFDLIANGNGPRLVYFYSGSAGPVTLQDPRTVLWGRVEAGQNSQVLFIVRNDGTGPATISSAVIVDAKSAFRIAEGPGFPATLAPGDQFSLSLAFSPIVLGDNSARLRVDSELFTLLGSGTPPPPLPAVELRGLSPNLDPLQQPAVSLTLAAPYPLPLFGTLALSVSSRSFEVDPAVQFATGGRSVTFTVPANSTRAQFPGGTEIRLQTGTVASTLNVTATFALESGIAVTSGSPPEMSYSILEGPPRLLDIQINSRTANGFTLVLTGLSTTRTLRQLDVSLAGLPSVNVPNGRFSLNIESASSTWYRSTESRTYGSLFAAIIPFTLQGLDASKTLSQMLESVSATVTNEKGQSNSISVRP